VDCKGLLFAIILINEFLNSKEHCSSNALNQSFKITSYKLLLQEILTPSSTTTFSKDTFDVALDVILAKKCPIQKIDYFL